jgi:hypothetical protein
MSAHQIFIVLSATPIKTFASVGRFSQQLRNGTP